ncbi:carboxymuconolactone decarboxylase family protein [Streptomyces sp. NPDC059740]|uniref:carboxymuconolactone decarboxylase family protein n=1 Tax=Streptomyces sp. NPDC059740 TaxID=3346926 RepID=UPI003657415D
MSRIPLTPPRTLLYRAAAWYSRRAYKEVLDPVKALAHNPRVAFGYLLTELSAAKWNRLDPTLKCLAEMVAAARIGCSWCMDFGYWESHNQGVPVLKIRNAPAWREHRGDYDEWELLVMEYTEAVTETPPAVTDDMAARLRAHLGDPAFVELTAVVALENLRSRVNGAFGLSSQGFSDRCPTPGPGAVRPAS